VTLTDLPAAMAVTTAWPLFAARQVYRLRRERAATQEREALARMRIAHAERTGDFRCLDPAGCHACSVCSEAGDYACHAGSEAGDGARAQNPASPGARAARRGSAERSGSRGAA
jgi:hypothetical protein